MKNIIDNNNQRKVESASTGGTKVDNYSQTENLNTENNGKQMTHSLINQAEHCDLNIFDNTQQCKEINERYEHNSNFENKIEFNSRNNYNNNSREGAKDELMRGMLNYFESLQVSMPLPKFDGIKKNPIEFIKELEKYFIRKNVSENLKLIIIEDALVGKARMWHDARSFPFISYQHFKDKFLDEFYSVEARMVAKSTWKNRRCQSNEQSLQDYYTEQLRTAKFCLSSLKEYEINYLIIRQLPQRAREVLATIDYMDTAKIMQALTRLDVTRQDAERETSLNKKKMIIAQIIVIPMMVDNLD